MINFAALLNFAVGTPVLFYKPTLLFCRVTRIKLHPLHISFVMFILYAIDEPQYFNQYLPIHVVTFALCILNAHSNCYIMQTYLISNMNCQVI